MASDTARNAKARKKRTLRRPPAAVLKLFKTVQQKIARRLKP